MIVVDASSSCPPGTAHTNSPIASPFSTPESLLRTCEVPGAGVFQKDPNSFRFGGLIAAGVLADLNGAHGIAGWRWLFIIEGTATSGIAIIAAQVAGSLSLRSTRLIHKTDSPCPTTRTRLAGFRAKNSITHNGASLRTTQEKKMIGTQSAACRR